MRRVFPLLVLAIALSGCVDSERAPLMGNWTGGFTAKRVDGSSAPGQIQGESFKGFLQLYRNKDSFKLHLNSPKQAFDVTGTWALEDDRILLRVGEITFENPPEEQQQAMSIRIVKPDEIRNTLGRTVVLDLSADRKRAVGLDLKMGFVEGQLDFEKGQATRRVEAAYDRMNKNR